MMVTLLITVETNFYIQQYLPANTNDPMRDLSPIGTHWANNAFIAGIVGPYSNKSHQ